MTNLFFLVLSIVVVLLSFTSTCQAQVSSPKVLLRNQIDASSLRTLSEGICAQAKARTPREKAEAIWRFFLTDGRYVKPGFWYHIAGWAYEEPTGEVLDPIKLLNSYGFGLCYHIAPLLEAVFEAAGFQDARVWFLTGHTVTEAFYAGAYHYFDSDMMGYNPIGHGSAKRLPVASVRQLEQNSGILLGKLLAPTRVDPSQVDSPWYPADVNEAAIGGLSELFTTTQDNWLFPDTRYSQEHTMDFVLRPGERLSRYFHAEEPRLFYLPYQFDGKISREFPKAVDAYHVRTEDGPKSQKDTRSWATGKIEYRPVLQDRNAYYPAWNNGFNENLRLPVPGTREFLTRQDGSSLARAVFEMPSPYVLIGAAFQIQVNLQSEQHTVQVETSTDGGRRWALAGRLKGPYRGQWKTEPAVDVVSEHGRLTEISGSYGYLVRITLGGPVPAEAVQIEEIELTSRLQLNPRTLPELRPGSNELVFTSGNAVRRRTLPVVLPDLSLQAMTISQMQVQEDGGQSFLVNHAGREGVVVFEIENPDRSPLLGFDAGARFLDLSSGLAPDKLTAEVRPIQFKIESMPAVQRTGTMEWSLSPAGPFQVLWQYSPNLVWLDQQPIDRILVWPEVDRTVRSLPANCTKVYLRYRLRGLAADKIRLAAWSAVPQASSTLEVTHLWDEGSTEKFHVEKIHGPAKHNYLVELGTAEKISNKAVIFSVPRK